MRLDKLEIYGFKSFAKRVEVVFDKGITAIVGPNGSGKSNIADAIRWVLGEQSVKSLRGGKMEDIIFSGSDSARAQAFSEVVLTLDNSSGALPIEYKEVSVMRRVYRSGEGEYFINRTPCRLRDIIDLFRDTGIGKEGYSIIGQGRVDEILSSRGEDRRAVFEEAAGVMKFKVRKEEAEKKLERTADNLMRLNDIISELDSQLEPLSQQSEKAKLFLKLRDEIRILELNQFILQYEKNLDRKRQQSELIKQLNDEKLKTQAEVENISAKKREVAEDIGECEGVISNRNRTILSLTEDIEKRAAQAEVLVERIENMKASIAKAKEEAREQLDRLEHIAEKLEHWERDGTDRMGMLSELEDEILRSEETLQSKIQEIQEAETKLEEIKSSIIESMNNMSTSKVQSSRLETMLQSLSSRKSDVQKEIERLDAELDSIDLEKTSEAEGRTALNLEKDALSAEISIVQASAEKLNVELLGREEKIRSYNAKLMDMQSRLRMLNEMKSEYEGFYASVRNLLRDCKKDTALGNGVIGVVAELIEVEGDLETAIEMALGGALQNIVTEDESAAKRAIEHLREKRYGRATFMPLSTVKGRTLNENERKALECEGILGIASELTRCDERFKGVLENLLGRTLIAKDLDSAIRASRVINQALRISTLQGDIINPGGTMTGGSVQKKEFSLLGRGREIEELARNIKRYSSLVEEEERESVELKSNVLCVKAKEQEISDQIKISELALIRQGEKLEMLDKLMKQYEVQKQKFADEKEQIEENSADIQLRLNESKAQQGKLERSHTSSQNDVTECQEKVNAIRKSREAMQDALTEKKVKFAGLQKEAFAAKNERERLERERDSLTDKRQNELTDMDSNAAKVDEWTEQLAAIKGAIDAKREELDEEKTTLNLEEYRLQKLRQSVGMLEVSETSAHETLNDIVDRIHKAELNTNKYEIECESMQNKIWEDYELTYDGALAFRTESTFDSKLLEEQRTQMRELGDVNVRSIEDYAQVKQRHSMLLEQSDDLIAAQDDLRALIVELEQTIRERFFEQFEKINENFGVTFSELFGGGRAELRLSNAKDVLSSDIEIIAQPPGKKLQLLSLLSGGERALTAIALLFSMLKLKPTPFCVLDEIEASLDEANVDNFAQYLKRYADKTQFILITHRKGSMVVCDSLYGVAMEDKGVSRLVSVKMDDIDGDIRENTA